MTGNWEDFINRAAEFLDSSDLTQMELRVANSRSVLEHDDDMYNHFAAGAVFGAAKVFEAVADGRIKTKDQSARIERLLLENEQLKRELSAD